MQQYREVTKIPKTSRIILVQGSDEVNGQSIYMYNHIQVGVELLSIWALKQSRMAAKIN